MTQLKEIDLSKAEELKQDILKKREELKKTEKELTALLVALNLDYYGTSPSEYYKSIDKSYETEDGYKVTIKDGDITIEKRLQDNLTVNWKSSFNKFTKFDYIRANFKYDSGRYIESAISMSKMYKKHEDKFKRFHEILESEKVFNPFKEFEAFYSFTDFYNIPTKRVSIK